MIKAGVIQRSIGTKVMDANGTTYCSNIIVKGTILPTGVKKVYHPAVDGQEHIDIELLVNDCEDARAPADKCEAFGNVTIDLPGDVTAEDEVEVVFTAGLNGLFIINSSCKGSKQEKMLDL